MRFLKLLLLLLLVIAGGMFSYRNWVPITVELWGGMVMDTKLPVLLFVAFLAGLIPYFLMHRATRWSLNRKLESVERSLSELRTPPPVVPSPSAAPSPAASPALAPTAPSLAANEGTIAPGAAPIAVPPGVS
jgi:lipopolysaccharide assembly protein A